MEKIVILFSVFISLSVSVLAQNKVVIYGISDHHPGIETISLFKEPEFPDSEFNNNRSDFHRVEKKENSFSFHVECEKEGQYYIEAFLFGGERQRIFLTPGDSVCFKVGNDTFAFEFSGTNASHYNFDYQKRKYMRGFPGTFYREGMDYMSYKHSLEKRRDEELRFLESYRKEYGLSEACFQAEYGAIINQYIIDLYIDPISRTKDFFKDTFPTEYKESKLTPIKGASGYRFAMRYKYIDSLHPDVFQNIDSVYQAIVSSSEDIDKEYLYALFLGYYAKQRNKLYANSLIDAFKNASDFVKDPGYLDYVKRAEEFYSVILMEQFPDEVLDSTLLKEYGTDVSLTFRQVLNKYEGEALYIDFWTSWLPPCTRDIRDSAMTKKYLQDKGIRYLYFSCWDKEDHWKKVVEEENIPDCQYLLMNGNDVPLLRFLSIQLPLHHIVLDKDHGIYSGRAPRASSDYFEDLKTLIEKMDL